MKTCMECKHSIFNEQWGECKCSKKHRRVDVKEAGKCPDYKSTVEKKKTKEES